MKRIDNRLKLIALIGLAAVMTLPGAGVPPAATAQSAERPAPQETFGLFLDPHAEPGLRIRLPVTYRAARIRG
jgi:hypothetical protein